MTYFSDFDTSEYYYNDETLRKSVLSFAEDVYLEPVVESLPNDIFDEVDLPYFIETKDNSWQQDYTDLDWD